MSLRAASLLLLGCSARPPAGARLEVPPPPEEPAPAAQSSAAERRPPVRPTTSLVERGEIAVPLPEGYYDASDELARDHLRLVFVAEKSTLGYQPSIALMKAPLPGGTFDDPVICTQTGQGLVDGGTEASGSGGSLKSALLIDGPLGKACQIHIVAPQGVALITELHRPGNTPQTPRDVWLMTCNHAQGDAVAEATCRATLAGFRFRDP